MKFGRLTVLSYMGKKSNGNTYWLCQCQCGKRKSIRRGDFVSGKTQSCGCLNLEIMTKHGQHKTPEYKAWVKMRFRCLNPNEPSFHSYGGRGIKVCKRWAKFENFIEDMGKRPSKKHSIDRVDVNGDYKPSNCRWATIRQQSRNRRDNHWITYKGKTLILNDWAKKLKIHKATLRARFKRGLSVKDCFERPLR